MDDTVFDADFFLQPGCGKRHAVARKKVGPAHDNEHEPERKDCRKNKFAHGAPDLPGQSQAAAHRQKAAQSDVGACKKGKRRCLQQTLLSAADAALCGSHKQGAVACRGFKGHEKILLIWAREKMGLRALGFAMETSPEALDGKRCFRKRK